MSIDMHAPETLLGKIDAAANCVSQIRLALSIGDTTHAMKAVAEAERHLFNALSQIEESPSADL